MSILFYILEYSRKLIKRERIIMHNVGFRCKLLKKCITYKACHKQTFEITIYGNSII